MQCYQKSALFFLVLCCMQKLLKKRKRKKEKLCINKHTLFHMTFSTMFSKVYCLSSLAQYLSVFIYSLKEKSPSNCHQKCPSIGMLSGGRLSFPECHPGPRYIYWNQYTRASSNHCICKIRQPYTTLAWEPFCISMTWKQRLNTIDNQAAKVCSHALSLSLFLKINRL